MRLGASLLLAGSLCGAAPAAPADSRTMIVTSDSGAYCHTLSEAVAAHGDLPREVKELKTQGDGLCDEGQVRGGINRLRRALLMLTQKN